MKSLLVTICLLAATSAYASDQLQAEIVCNEELAPGAADHGLTLTLKSNDTAWMKVVEITENTIMGPMQNASIQVPLNPTVESGSGFIPEDILTYEGEGLIFEIRVLRIASRPLNGGYAVISLPGQEPKSVSLSCEYAN